MSSAPYVVCVPSYGRATGCNDKTLATLHRRGISAARVYVYVANKAEHAAYHAALNPDWYHRLIIGKKGLVQQRAFIMASWPAGAHLVFLDDDVESIDLSLSPRFRGHSLDYFLRAAFRECASQRAYIWGVYAVYNPFFRRARQEVTTMLNYIVGAFYGIINRPGDPALRLTVTAATGQKEDVERTIRYFLRDGAVVRFNRVGFVTAYYGREGGLGRFEDRLEPMRQSSLALQKKYPAYGYVKERKNGMTEFVLRKIPARTETARTETAGHGKPDRAAATARRTGTGMSPGTTRRRAHTRRRGKTRSRSRTWGRATTQT